MATYDHFEQFGRTDDSGDRLENQPCPDGQEQLDRCPQLMSEVTEEEIQEAIRCLEKEKSAGEDDIPNEFIIEGGWPMVLALTIMFNQFIATKYGFCCSWA